MTVGLAIANAFAWFILGWSLSYLWMKSGYKITRK